MTAGGSGLAGATVHLVTGADGYVTSTTTNGSGAYTFSLTPGDYKLWIQPNEPGYSDQWYDGVSAIGSATLIAVSGNTVRNIALVGPPSTFTLSGNVTAGGSGLAGATVHLVTGADGYVTSTTTNGSGAYTFSLTPGSQAVDPAQRARLLRPVV